MLPPREADHLKEALQSARVTLFLGAGFSTEAKNAAGLPLPAGWALSKSLWKWLGYDEPFPDAALGEVFEDALLSAKGRPALHSFLTDTFTATDIPEWYDLLPAFFWRRIYTTNVDNVVEQVFSRVKGSPKLDTRIFPTHDYEDRDPSLTTVQYIKLNGDVAHGADKVTFSPRQYAARGGTDAWYDHFVRDYARTPALFIGTELREPLFYEALQSRDKRFPEEAEHRAQAYLVVPKMPAHRRAPFEQLKIFPVEASAKDFLTYLRDELLGGQLPARNDVLKRSAPELLPSLSLGAREIRAARGFFSAFRTVPTEVPKSPIRGKSFLLGTAPAWEDILRGMDASREITGKLYGELTTGPAELLMLHGGAGSGKSTTLKRLAVTLAEAGRGVFFSEGDILPSLDDISAYVKTLAQDRVYLFIDNASSPPSYLRELSSTVATLGQGVSLVLAARTNEMLRWREALNKHPNVHEQEMPVLEGKDVDNLLDILATNGLLGKLEGKSREEQRHAFGTNARRQLLVAMKEATEGPGFDEIIDGEFAALDDGEDQITYLVAALATEVNQRISADELLACSSGPMNTALERIERRLSGILIPWDAKRDFYQIRHPVIAGRIVTSSAPRALLREAYDRLLHTLAVDMSRPPDRKSRVFRLYRSLINHRPIFDRFNRAIGEARALYDSVGSVLRDDYQYWLQYGLLELSAGTLDLAAPYIASAVELDGDDDYVTTAYAHLTFRKAIDEAVSLGVAQQLRDEAESILGELIRRRGEYDSRVHHILLSQKLAWINRWCRDPTVRVNELKELLTAADAASAQHRQNQEVRQLRDDIKATLIRSAVT